MTFYKSALTCSALILSLGLGSNALAQAKLAAAAPMSDAQLNALVEQLTKSGKLDAAVDASIKRFVAEQQASAMKQREAEMARISEQAVKARKVNPVRDHIYGSPKAEWSLIVYSDLECPFCKVHGGVPEAVAKSIGVDKMNVVFRHFPLPSHGEAARKEAVAAECVARQGGNDGFFNFVNTVLQKSALNGQGLPGGDAELLSIAKESGVKNDKQFEACMQDPKAAENVRADHEDGLQAGVTGTPGNILRNNKTGRSIAFHGADRGGPASMEARVRGMMAPAPAK